MHSLAASTREVLSSAQKAISQFFWLSVQMSVTYFLTFQSDPAWNRLQRQPALATSLQYPWYGSFSGQLASALESFASIEKLVISIIIPTSHNRNIKPCGKAL